MDKFVFPEPLLQNQPEEKPTEPFCHDKHILPIWKDLKKDKDFQEWLKVEEPGSDCRDLFEVKEFDLNKDGNKEILLRARNIYFCGGTGNCSFWIYKKSGKSYRKILYSSDYVDVNEMGEQILKKKTNGYFDILLKGHFTAGDTIYNFYKFDGKKYKLYKDLVHTCTVLVGVKPKWEFITWKEFRRRNQY